MAEQKQIKLEKDGEGYKFPTADASGVDLTKLANPLINGNKLTGHYNGQDYAFDLVGPEGKPLTGSDGKPLEFKVDNGNIHFVIPPTKEEEAAAEANYQAKMKEFKDAKAKHDAPPEQSFTAPLTGGLLGAIGGIILGLITGSLLPMLLVGLALGGGVGYFGGELLGANKKSRGEAPKEPNRAEYVAKGQLKGIGGVGPTGVGVVPPGAGGPSVPPLGGGSTANPPPPNPSPTLVDNALNYNDAALDTVGLNDNLKPYAYAAEALIAPFGGIASIKGLKDLVLGTKRQFADPWYTYEGAKSRIGYGLTRPLEGAVKFVTAPVRYFDDTVVGGMARARRGLLNGTWVEEKVSIASLPQSKFTQDGRGNIYFEGQLALERNRWSGKLEIPSENLFRQVAGDQTFLTTQETIDAVQNRAFGHNPTSPTTEVSYARFLVNNGNSTDHSSIDGLLKRQPNIKDGAYKDACLEAATEKLNKALPHQSHPFHGQLADIAATLTAHATDGTPLQRAMARYALSAKGESVFKQAAARLTSPAAVDTPAFLQAMEYQYIAEKIIEDAPRNAKPSADRIVEKLAEIRNSSPEGRTAYEAIAGDISSGKGRLLAQPDKVLTVRPAAEIIASVRAAGGITVPSAAGPTPVPSAPRPVTTPQQAGIPNWNPLDPSKNKPGAALIEGNGHIVQVMDDGKSKVVFKNEGSTYKAVDPVAAMALVDQDAGLRALITRNPAAFEEPFALRSAARNSVPQLSTAENVRRSKLVGDAAIAFRRHSLLNGLDKAGKVAAYSQFDQRLKQLAGLLPMQDSAGNDVYVPEATQAETLKLLEEANGKRGGVERVFEHVTQPTTAAEADLLNRASSPASTIAEPAAQQLNELQRLRAEVLRATSSPALPRTGASAPSTNTGAAPAEPGPTPRVPTSNQASTPAVQSPDTAPAPEAPRTLDLNRLLADGHIQSTPGENGVSRVRVTESGAAAGITAEDIAKSLGSRKYQFNQITGVFEAPASGGSGASYPPVVVEGYARNRFDGIADAFSRAYEGVKGRVQRLTGLKPALAVPPAMRALPPVTEPLAAPVAVAPAPAPVPMAPPPQDAAAPGRAGARQNAAGGEPSHYLKVGENGPSVTEQRPQASAREIIFERQPNGDYFAIGDDGKPLTELTETQKPYFERAKAQLGATGQLLKLAPAKAAPEPAAKVPVAPEPAATPAEGKKSKFTVPLSGGVENIPESALRPRPMLDLNKRANPTPNTKPGDAAPSATSYSVNDIVRGYADAHGFTVPSEMNPPGTTIPLNEATTPELGQRGGAIARDHRTGGWLLPDPNGVPIPAAEQPYAGGRPFTNTGAGPVPTTPGALTQPVQPTPPGGTAGAPGVVAEGAGNVQAGGQPEVKAPAEPAASKKSGMTGGIGSKAGAALMLKGSVDIWRHGKDMNKYQLAEAGGGMTGGTLEMGGGAIAHRAEGTVKLIGKAAETLRLEKTAKALKAVKLDKVIFGAKGAQSVGGFVVPPLLALGGAKELFGGRDPNSTDLMHAYHQGHGVLLLGVGAPGTVKLAVQPLGKTVQAGGWVLEKATGKALMKRVGAKVATHAGTYVIPGAGQILLTLDTLNTAGGILISKAYHKESWGTAADTTLVSEAEKYFDPLGELAERERKRILSSYAEQRKGLRHDAPRLFTDMKDHVPIESAILRLKEHGFIQTTAELDGASADELKAKLEKFQREVGMEQSKRTHHFDTMNAPKHNKKIPQDQLDRLAIDLHNALGEIEQPITGYRARKQYFEQIQSADPKLAATLRELEPILRKQFEGKELSTDDVKAFNAIIVERANDQLVEMHKLHAEGKPVLAYLEANQKMAEELRDKDLPPEMIRMLFIRDRAELEKVVHQFVVTDASKFPPKALLEIETEMPDGKTVTVQRFNMREAFGVLPQTVEQPVIDALLAGRVSKASDKGEFSVQVTLADSANALLVDTGDGHAISASARKIMSVMKDQNGFEPDKNYRIEGNTLYFKPDALKAYLAPSYVDQIQNGQRVDNVNGVVTVSNVRHLAATFQRSGDYQDFRRFTEAVANTNGETPEMAAAKLQVFTQTVTLDAAVKNNLAARIYDYSDPAAVATNQPAPSSAWQTRLHSWRALSAFALSDSPTAAQALRLQAMKQQVDGIVAMAEQQTQLSIGAARLPRIGETPIDLAVKPSEASVQALKAVGLEFSSYTRDAREDGQKRYQFVFKGAALGSNEELVVHALDKGGHFEVVHDPVKKDFGFEAREPNPTLPGVRAAASRSVIFSLAAANGMAGLAEELHRQREQGLSTHGYRQDQGIRPTGNGETHVVFKVPSQQRFGGEWEMRDASGKQKQFDPIKKELVAHRDAEGRLKRIELRDENPKTPGQFFTPSTADLEAHGLDKAAFDPHSAAHRTAFAALVDKGMANTQGNGLLPNGFAAVREVEISKDASQLIFSPGNQAAFGGKPGAERRLVAHVEQVLRDGRFVSMLTDVENRLAAPNEPGMPGQAGDYASKQQSGWTPIALKHELGTPESHAEIAGHLNQHAPGKASPQAPALVADAQKEAKPAAAPVTAPVSTEAPKDKDGTKPASNTDAPNTSDQKTSIKLPEVQPSAMDAAKKESGVFSFAYAEASIGAGVSPASVPNVNVAAGVAAGGRKEAPMGNGQA